jgi:hypothetical protein
MQYIESITGGIIPGISLINEAALITLEFLILLYPFSLVPLASFPSELICNCGSYRQLVGLIGRVASPVAKPLPTQENKNTEERGEAPMLRVGSELTIPLFQRAKIF